MKRTKQHIEAFTIMNVLVGMVISALLVGFVYTIYTNLSKMTYDYQMVHSSLNDYELAKADLKRNVESADEILEYPKGFSVVAKGKTVNYFLREGQLVKKQNDLEQVLFEHVKNIELAKEMESAEGVNEMISGISVVFLVENQELSVYIYRLFDSRNKLNSIL